MIDWVFNLNQRIMKTKQIYLFSLHLLLIFSSLRCYIDDEGVIRQKRPTELPPITTEGKNTFGCLVDGELLVPYPRKLIKDKFVFDYSGVLDGTLQVGGTMEGETGYESKSVSLYLLSRVVDEGEYVLYTDSTTYNSSGFPNIIDNVRVRITDESGNATFNSWRVPNPDCGRLNVLRLDTLSRIIAGTFYFDAVNKEGDTIKVTDGRFDLKY